MNDPSAQPIDIEEQRAWLLDHRRTSGASWAELAKRMGIPSGTLSQFGSERGYAGNEQGVAEKVYRYRQLLATQATIAVDAPEIPGFFETESSRQLVHLLNWAQRGRIVVAAMGPGNSKTMTARQFAACYPNVFLATMSASTADMTGMQQEVLAALGMPDAVGTARKLSHQVRDRVRDMKNPLIIVDEAQHLSAKAIEEARSWHDNTGVGLALFGNIGVLSRLEGTNRGSAFAQLYSRVSLKIVRAQPLQADADALAEAWGVHGDKEIGQIRRVAAQPGGLRGATMMLELAAMIASAEQAVLAVDHLQDAWAQLSSRAVAA